MRLMAKSRKRGSQSTTISVAPHRVFVIIPNYNGADELPRAVDSVLGQSFKDFTLVLVDNASSDKSKEIIEQYCRKDPRVQAVWNDKNYGYTGGVNPGLELAIEAGADYAAPFNNDAVAHKDWLKHLINFLDENPKYGIAACNLLHIDGKTYDSTADQYSVWGLPFPRGRDEPVGDKYKAGDIFGASGGASMYRVKMLKEVGLFDQDFFAYYEDIDLSFRAQYAGWKVRYVPESTVFHAQGVTSERIGSGFTTYQYMKNAPMVVIKDVPTKYMWRVVPRFALQYSLSFANAVFKKHYTKPALRGFWEITRLMPKKIHERHQIQRSQKVSDGYMWSLFLHDLPPTAHKLRKLRASWWKLRRKS